MEKINFCTEEPLRSLTYFFRQNEYPHTHHVFWSITPEEIDYVPFANGGGQGLVADFQGGEFQSLPRQRGSDYRDMHARLVRSGTTLPEFELEYQRVAKFQNELNEEEKRRASEQAALQAQYLVMLENQKKLQACQNTDQYQLYAKRYPIAQNIESWQDTAKRAQEEINRQRQAAKFSGYVNNQVMYDMGQKIVTAAQLNKNWFAAYKKLGGKAKSIDVVHSATEVNPCKM